MQAVRCTRCGETRWSLFPGTAEHALALPCEICGGPTVPERRRPGTRHGFLPVERRTRRAPAASRPRPGSYPVAR